MYKQSEMSMSRLNRYIKVSVRLYDGFKNAYAISVTPGLRRPVDVLRDWNARLDTFRNIGKDVEV